MAFILRSTQLVFQLCPATVNVAIISHARDLLHYLETTASAVIASARLQSKAACHCAAVPAESERVSYASLFNRRAGCAQVSQRSCKKS